MQDSVIGVGVVGAGRWGAHHALVFNKLKTARFVAVCDTNPSVAAKFADDFGAEAWFTDHREMIDHPGIDAVSVATPDFAHGAAILDALNAGKHVLTEKPLSTDVSEAEAIKAAVDKSGKVLMVDFHNRASMAFIIAKDEISKGAIGAPVHASARLSNTKAVPLDMLEWAEKSSALWFVGSHLVDMLRFLIEDEIVRVYAVAGEGVLKSEGLDAKDFHLSVLEFRDGAKALIENSWILAEDGPIIFDFRVDLVGTDGQIAINPSHNAVYQQIGTQGLRYRDTFSVLPSGRSRVGGFIHEAIARFVDAVNGAPPLATVDDGLAVTRVLDAIERSAASGMPVEVVGTA